MSSPLIPTFAHRSAEHGVDSICTRCFVTVATVEEESDLDHFERQHVCDPEILERYAQQKRRSLISATGVATDE